MRQNDAHLHRYGVAPSRCRCKGVVGLSSGAIGPARVQPRTCSAPQELGHPERQVDGLAGVQSRVTGGGVAKVELVLQDVAEATQTFGDVVPGELDVHAAGPGAGGVVGVEESTELEDDVV